MRIALVHEYLTQLGGGERVLKALCEMYPEAPIFTLIYDEKRTKGAFKYRKIHTSFLQKILGAKKFFRSLIWLMPLAIEQFDLSGFDTVISVSHSYGKGIITRPSTKHICYCLTPTRYLWHDAGLPLKPFSQFLLTYLRTWDYQASQRPDYFIADSENVRQRVKKYYNRKSEVIYPPVGLAKTASESAHRTSPTGYFLMVGRVVPYKRLDIAIEAFRKLPKEQLIVIGEWPLYSKLKRIVGFRPKNIKFLGRVSDSELARYYANCKALIFPQEEDFGIIPVEAMAAGRPVIAFRAGGALETVKEGESGIFFNEQSPESLIRAIERFKKLEFNPEKIREHAKKFDKEVFSQAIKKFIFINTDRF